jgi:hypothetical protein
MGPADFKDALTNRVVLFDGAMGTEIYARGVFINRCYDELNLGQPEIVREIHASYRKAGADVLTTNTFGANRVRKGCAHKARLGRRSGRAGELGPRRRGDAQRKAVALRGARPGGRGRAIGERADRLAPRQRTRQRGDRGHARPRAARA